MEEILHQLIGRLSHCLQGFIHPRWCRISSINSMSIKLRVGEEDQRGWEGHPKADLWYVCVERTPRKRRWNPFFGGLEDVFFLFKGMGFPVFMLVLGWVLLLMRSQVIADHQLPIRMNPHEIHEIFFVSTRNPQFSDVSVAWVWQLVLPNSTPCPPNPCFSFQITAASL